MDEFLRTEDPAKGQGDRGAQASNAVASGIFAKKNSNGLREFAGKWSEEDQRDFNAAVAPFAKIDADLWR